VAQKGRCVSAGSLAALLVPSGVSLDDAFAGLEWRCKRLHQDQQVEEWAGAGPKPEGLARP
jgi:hypothetical protein